MKNKIIIAVIGLVVFSFGAILVSYLMLPDPEKNEPETTGYNYQEEYYTETEASSLIETSEAPTIGETEETEEETQKFDVFAHNYRHYYVSTKSSELNVREKPDEKSKKRRKILPYIKNIQKHH